MSSLEWPRATRLPRFRTLGGAVVHIIRHSYRSAAGETVTGYAWRCAGCDAAGSNAEWIDTVRFPAELRLVRREANAHAGQCRSLPKTGKTGQM